MFHENSQQIYPNINYNCLKKYNENNKHFSMEILFENTKQEPIGYICIYQYELNKIKLEYNIKNNIWKIILIDYSYDENILNSVFDNIQLLSLEEQIEIIIRRFDEYFIYINQLQMNQRDDNKDSIQILTIHEDDDEQQQQQEKSIKNFDNDDIVDYNFHSLINGSRSKFNNLAPPPVAPRRSRQNSACSTQSSVRYASFIPPPTAPIRRRRVIESILLHVHRKKKPFEKIADLLKGTEPITMDQLGLQFLNMYDGKFNYREGYTFMMHFRKKVWFLTIQQIKCVDCPLGDIGPRSVLILSYKGQYTSVHV